MGSLPAGSSTRCKDRQSCSSTRSILPGTFLTMTDQTFDPQAMLDQAFEGSNATKIINIPEGEYTAMIQDLGVAQWVSRDQTKSGMKLSMRMILDDQKARE